MLATTVAFPPRILEAACHIEETFPLPWFQELHFLPVEYLYQFSQGPSPAADALPPVLGSFTVSFNFKLHGSEPPSCLTPDTPLVDACKTRTNWAASYGHACSWPSVILDLGLRLSQEGLHFPVSHQGSHINSTGKVKE